MTRTCLYEDALMILVALARRERMTRTVIHHELFGKGRSKDRIEGALSHLYRLRVAGVEYSPTGGRPVETWYFSPSPPSVPEGKNRSTE